MVSEELEKLSPEERVALESIQERQRRLSYVYQNHIQELAKEGEENGYWINIVVDEGQQRALKRQRFFRQKWVTTKEHNELMKYRGKANKEPDPETMEDMTNRFYESASKKLLGISHELYENAINAEIRMAVDACIHTMSWNGNIGANTKDRDEFAQKSMEIRNKFVLGKDKEELADEPSSSYTPLSTDYPDY